MTKNLYIFDLMPLMYAGHVNKRSQLQRTEDLGTRVHSVITQTGGTSLLFNHLYNLCGTGDIVVCSDRRPTIKEEMSPDYKSTRSHNRGVYLEKLAAEYIIEKCNISLLYRDGYEADDFIYTLVQKQHDAYDNIYIYTGDSDMYFLVDDVVSIRPPSSNGKTVNRQNYETIKVSNNRYRYNSITMGKICGGDSSDNIASLPQDVWKKFSETMFNESLFPLMGDKNAMLYWCSMLCPEAVPQMELVFPLDVEDVDTNFKTPDLYAIRNWGHAINNKEFRGTGDSSFDVSPYVEEMQVTLGIYTEEV